MAHPSTSLSTLRPDLADSFHEFGLEADRLGLIGTRIFPIIETSVQAGTFGRIPLEQLLMHRETVRAPGSGYQRHIMTFVQDSFATIENGAEEPIDDRERQMYTNFFSIEQLAASRAIDAVLKASERNVVAATANNTGISSTAVAGGAWTSTASTPLADVEAAVQSIYDASGLWPNALIVNRKTFRNLRNVAEIVDRSKAQNYADVRAGAINEQMLSICFDLEVIVGGATQNMANAAASATPQQMWPDDIATVARIAVSQDVKEPCIGRTFHWGADGSTAGDGRNIATLDQYRNEEIRSDVIRARRDTHEKVLYTAAAHRITGVA